MAEDSKLVKGQQIDKKDKSGNSALHVAAKGGHAEVVKMLLDFGSSVNEKNNEGETALHLASRDGHEAVVKHLLEAGADPYNEDKSGTTPWHVAAAGGYVSVLSLFGKRKTQEEPKTFESNSETSDLDTKLLADDFPTTNKKELSINEMNNYFEKSMGGNNFSKRSNVDSFTADSSSSNSDSDSDDIGYGILAAGPTVFFRQNNAFHLSSMIEYLEEMVIRRVGHDVLNEVSRGRVDVNARNENGFTPLHIAAMFGAEEAVRKFLKKSDVHAKSYNGVPTMTMAAAGGSVRIIKMLFRAGANINDTDKEGHSPLHIASYFGHVSAVKCLLSLGLDPNQKSQEGNTALHIVATRGYCGVAVALLERGASKDARNCQGLKPEFYALQKNDFRLLSLLLPTGKF